MGVSGTQGKDKGTNSHPPGDPASRLQATQEQLRSCERALSESEARFAATFHQSPVAAVITTEDDRFLDVNEAFLKLTGYTRRDLIGEAAADLGFSFLERNSEANPFLEGLASDHIEHEIHTQDEEFCITLISPREIELHGQQCTLTMFHDITERRRLERELLDTTEQTLGRVSSDLHDELGQNLVALAHRTDALARKLSERELEPLSDEARNLAETLRESLEFIRKLSHRLSPLAVESAGLAGALQQLARHTERAFNMPCRLSVDPSALPEDRETMLHLYRIAQEATTNAVKHADASEVLISLSVEEGENVLRICDNGSGLDPDRLDTSEGHGLRIMLYRTDVLGGKLEVGPGKNGGTTIECRLPR